MKIAIGGDHASVDLKPTLINLLIDLNHEVEDFGCFGADSVDYPDFAHLVCESIVTKKNELGILICGSGNGISMAANKHKDIRAALSWTPEIAELGRLHNDANVVSIPARFVTEEIAKEIVVKFLNTKFEGGRHLRRVNKINC